MVQAGQIDQRPAVSSRGLSVLMRSEAPTVGGDQSAEELRRELAQARRREAATAEVLRVISQSFTTGSVSVSNALWSIAASRQSARANRISPRNVPAGRQTDAL